MEQILPYLQITFSLLLIGTVALQQSGASLGGAFGDNFSSVFHTRRGLEKLLFSATIILAALFAASTFLALILFRL